MTGILLVVTLLTFASSAFSNCFFNRVLSPGQNLNLDSSSIKFSYCIWIFRCSNAESIAVQCSVFSIPDQNTSSCFNNYLSFSDGKETHRSCGNTFEKLNFSSDYIVAIFRRSRYFLNTFLCQVSCNANSLPTSERPSFTESDTTESHLKDLNSTDNSNRCTCGVKENSNRIVNGNDASLHEYPWQVMLRDKLFNRPFCGGTLICNKFIITANHCVDGILSENLVISLGDHNKLENSETNKTIYMNVVDIINHENYNSETDDNDIAILELAESVDFNDAIFPVCLPFGLKNTSLSGKMGTVTGWGTTSMGGPTSEVLNELEIQLMTTEECRSHSKYKSTITKNMICAYSNGKGDACHGDSGGPLTIVGEDEKVNLIGIVSWGLGCSLVGYPGVYTKVNNYLEWIKEKVKCNLCELE